MYEEIFEQVDRKIGVIPLRGLEERQYSSFILEIKPDMILIDPPIVKSVLVPMHDEEDFQMLAFTEDGIVSGLSKVIKRQVKPRNGLWVEKPLNIEKVQRRQHVRVPMAIPIHVTIGKMIVVKNEFEEVMSFETTSYNLSATGLSFLHKKELPRDLLYKIKMIFPNNNLSVETNARFIYTRAMLPDEGAPLPYLTGLHLTTIGKDDIEKIARIIFQYQIMLKKRGQ